LNRQRLDAAQRKRSLRWRAGRGLDL